MDAPPGRGHWEEWKQASASKRLPLPEQQRTSCVQGAELQRLCPLYTTCPKGAAISWFNFYTRFLWNAIEVVLENHLPVKTWSNTYAVLLLCISWGTNKVFYLFIYSKALAKQSEQSSSPFLALCTIHQGWMSWRELPLLLRSGRGRARLFWGTVELYLQNWIS